MPEQQPQQQQMTEEQVKALQEKIKNMSPEELKEFQKKQCIFCQIIAGKVHSRKIYEDDTSLVILDVNPANPGHMLIMPKEHYSIMPQIPDSQLSHIFSVAKALSNAALRALETQGSNIIVANGVAAGQKAQHFMAHLIPRMGNDGIKFELPQKTLAEDELKKISGILSKALGAKFEEKRKAAAVPILPQKKELGEAPKERLPEKLPLENKKFIAAEFKRNPTPPVTDLGSGKSKNGFSRFASQTIARSLHSLGRISKNAHILNMDHASNHQSKNDGISAFKEKKKATEKEKQIPGKKAQKGGNPPINLDDIANLLGKDD